jgi:hypothetical protein
MGALQGEPGGRALLLRALKNILRRALETDISLHRNPTGEPGEEVRLPGNSNSTRGLWKWNVSLYGVSARGNWRDGSLTEDTEGYVKEGSGKGSPP